MDLFAGKGCNATWKTASCEALFGKDRKQALIIKTWHAQLEYVGILMDDIAWLLL